MAGPALARLRIELEADSASLEKGLKDAAGAMRSAATAAVAVGSIIANVAMRIADTFAGAVSGVVDGIREVAAASRQLGIPVEELSRLRFAAESVEVSFDALREGMSTLAGKIGEAASNAGSEAARAFEAMGVSLRDADGDVRDLGDVFREVSERFRGYADDASRATLATALFGDKAEEMTRLVSMGTEELDRLADASDRSGNTVGRQAAQALDALAQAGRDSASALNGLATDLVNRVAPTLLTVIDYFRQAYNNSSLLRVAIEVLAGAFRVLVDALISVDGVLREIGNLITGVFRAVQALLSGDLTAAGAALAEMWGNVGKAWNEATAAITALHTGITSAWQTTVQFAGTDIAPRFLSTADAARAAAAAMRSFREEMANIVADPMTTYEEKLAAIQVAEQEGAITTEQAEKQRRRAYEMTARMAESSFQSIGRALSALFPKSKAAAIAEAMINTYVGITQALRSGPPPWNFIQAAAVGAMGFAQVRSITSTSEGGGGGAASAPSPSAGGDAGGVPSQMLTVQGIDPNSLISGASMRDLAERLLAFQADGGQVVFA